MRWILSLLALTCFTGCGDAEPNQRGYVISKTHHLNEAPVDEVIEALD